MNDTIVCPPSCFTVYTVLCFLSFTRLTSQSFSRAGTRTNLAHAHTHTDTPRVKSFQVCQTAAASFALPFCSSGKSAWFLESHKPESAIAVTLLQNRLRSDAMTKSKSAEKRDWVSVAANEQTGAAATPCPAKVFNELPFSFHSALV